MGFINIYKFTFIINRSAPTHRKGSIQNNHFIARTHVYSKFQESNDLNNHESRRDIHRHQFLEQQFSCVRKSNLRDLKIRIKKLIIRNSSTR